MTTGALRFVVAVGVGVCRREQGIQFEHHSDLVH
jgi:hypothetical protein